MSGKTTTETTIEPTATPVAAPEATTPAPSTSTLETPTTPVETPSSEPAVEPATPAPTEPAFLKEEGTPAEPKVETEPPAVEEFEEFEVELSQGSPLTEKDLESIAAEVEKYGLNKEQAQELVKAREETYQKGYNTVLEKYSNWAKQAEQELRSDEAFNSVNFDKSISTIKNVVQKFGDPEGKLVAFLNTPEGGNNLALGKFLLNIGKAMEGDTIQGKGSQGQAEKAKSTAERLYPGFFV